MLGTWPNVDGYTAYVKYLWFIRSHFGSDVLPQALCFISAMSSEVEHDGFVRLITFGNQGQQLLWHRGTAEVIQLPGQWSLAYPDNIGELTSLTVADPGEPRCVNDFLEKSLHEIDQDDLDDAPVRRFVFSKTPETSEFIQLYGPVRSHAVRLRNSFCDLKLEVYVHRYPPSDLGWCIFFTTPVIQTYLFGNQCHNRWACRNYDSWIRILQHTT